MSTRVVLCICKLLSGGEEGTKVIISYSPSTGWGMESQKCPGSTSRSPPCCEDRSHLHLLGRDPIFGLRDRSGNISDNSPLQGRASNISNCTQRHVGHQQHRFHGQNKPPLILPEFNLHHVPINSDQFTVFRQELDSGVMVWGLHCLHQRSQSERRCQL